MGCQPGSRHRSCEAFSWEQAKRTDRIDQVTQAVCAWLGRRCTHMLVSDQIPKTKDLKFEAAPVVRSQAKKQGPNNCQRLIAATQTENPAMGHKWVGTASAKNLCIKCERCTLFAQQVDPEPTVLFVLSHPCKHIPAQPSPETGIHPSHKIVNLVHLWRCSRCNANYSVRVQAKGRLTKVCAGPPKKAKGVSSSGGSVFPSPSAGFAALFSGTEERMFPLLRSPRPECCYGSRCLRCP